MLFLTAGNIHGRFHTKRFSKIVGLGKLMPITGVLWLAGFLAIVGSPPFGLFISEFTILRAGIAQHLWLAIALFIIFLILAFIGMANVFLHMFFGKPEVEPRRENKSGVIPVFVFALLALMLGVWIPGWLTNAIQQAALLLTGAAN
jgi:hydrogenase-4 component F